MLMRMECRGGECVNGSEVQMGGGGGGGGLVYSVELW